MTWSVFHVKYYVSMFSTATQVLHSVVCPSAQGNYNICYIKIDQCIVVFGNGLKSFLLSSNEVLLLIGR